MHDPHTGTLALVEDRAAFESMVPGETLRERSVFLGASIPDPARWEGNFDAREITDAVVAACRAVLTAGGTLVTAAHPTIAPLLLYVAGEFPPRDRVSVITYQSLLFETEMPEATLRFQASGVGEFRFTEAVLGETTDPTRRAGSPRLMREQMFRETDPVAATFVGGISGVRDEFELLVSMFPATISYAVGRPGGEAARLTDLVDSDLSPLLAGGAIYPSVFHAVIEDLTRRIR